MRSGQHNSIKNGLRPNHVRAPTAAVGAMAMGALAIGALAIGALAIKRLIIGRARIRRLEIDELIVRKLRFTNSVEMPGTSRTKSDGAT